MTWTTLGQKVGASRAEQAMLGGLLLFTVAAVLGFGVFGRHPELLRNQPGAVAFYGMAFVLFARGQVLLAAAALFFVLARRTGGRWLLPFALVYVTSLASELSGTTVGLPFGPYAYTDGLGVKWFGHVPLLIPLSWFLMAVPSYAIARRIVAGRGAAARIAVGSIVLLAWDLALDPAMSRATKYWVWGTTGVFYGMPWLNLVGWYVTGLALMMILSSTGSDRWLDRVPLRWLAGFYAANLALSVGIDAAAGLDGAVVASLLPLVLCAAALRGETARVAVSPAVSAAVSAARDLPALEPALGASDTRSVDVG